MKKIALALSFTVFFLLITACGVNQESEYGVHNDSGGTRFIDNRKAEMDKRQDKSVRDVTDQNPNFPNLTNSQGTTSTTNGVYEDKAREVVRDYSKFQPDEVWINGNQMWVTAHTKKEMNMAETDKEEAMLKDKLQRAIPRYNINVKITER
ncbi:hypothetical protein [Rossellomorea vietnamensis]|uniref:hypothetical protein n=1 Tax=Rossellomorea vietnamensis TaxID=218284 RepID=UPI001E5F4659|nr:hypothetical protein [Rossellomorea vietnamensis]MCC5803092.1 hypothetical protein [Rossellomorea vietnamensis]